MQTNMQYITDQRGTNISVILPIRDYERMVEELEELEDIRLYEEAKKEDDGEYIPAEDVFRSIEANQIGRASCRERV
jgi:hypothetical protein